MRGWKKELEEGDETRKQEERKGDRGNDRFEEAMRAKRKR